MWFAGQTPNLGVKQVRETHESLAVKEFSCILGKSKSRFKFRDREGTHPQGMPNTFFCSQTEGSSDRQGPGQDA